MLGYILSYLLLLLICERSSTNIVIDVNLKANCYILNW